MEIVGYFAYIMFQVDPEYKQNVRYENGGKVLYLLVLGEIYCCIESELLWYNISQPYLKV